MTGLKYSKSHDSSTLIYMLSMMKNMVDTACIQYSHELRIPVPVKKTCVAPTGSISKLPGVNGEGIHPLFARYYIQRIRFSTVDADQLLQLQKYRNEGYNVLPDPMVPNTMVVEIPMKSSLLEKIEKMGWDESILEDAHEISLEDLLSVQEMYQMYYADNAVSFTVNLNPLAYSPERLGRELQPFLGTLKGSTIFPERGYALAPYERVGKDVWEALRGSQAVVAGDAVDEDCTTGACPVR
jgi:adenosylcobalamin-dependent ribonucleoside-triphosphate reductase